MSLIHPTAIIDPKASIADDVSIGAYCIIKGDVHIGAGTVIHEHSHVHGAARIGSGCSIGPSAYVGLPPQHLRFRDDPDHPSFLIVGNNVTIRETATVHRAMTPGIEHATRIGDRVFLMVASHIAHDCVVEADVVFANGALIGGHTTVGERAFIGGQSAVHQFCRIGRLAVVAGGEGISHDVPPFGAVRYDVLKGYNAVGCRRAGIPNASIHAIRSVYRLLGRHRTVPSAVAAIRAEVPDLPEVRELLNFFATSRRGIMPSISPHLRLGESLGDD